MSEAWQAAPKGLDLSCQQAVVGDRQEPPAGPMPAARPWPHAPHLPTCHSWLTNTAPLPVTASTTGFHPASCSMP